MFMIAFAVACFKTVFGPSHCTWKMYRLVYRRIRKFTLRREKDKFYKYKQLQLQLLHLLHAQDTLSATSVSFKERR